MIVRSFTSATAAVLLSAMLTGCGGIDGVELNGKIFDWMGVSEAAKQANAREPRVPHRTGLVMPPDVNRLPDPGSENDPNDVTAALNDPDKKKAAAAAERARLHKAYCSGELTWKERAYAKDSLQTNKSPFGPCSAIGSMVNQ